MEDSTKVVSTGSKSRKRVKKGDIVCVLMDVTEPINQAGLTLEDNRFSFGEGVQVKDFSTTLLKNANTIKSDSKLNFQLVKTSSSPNINLTYIGENSYDFLNNDEETLLSVKKSAISVPIGFADAFRLTVTIIQP